MESFITLIPLISGTLFNLICKIDRTNLDKVKIIPPGWVFSLVWPILYLLIGYSWVKLRRISHQKYIDSLFIILITLLLLWMWFYNCLKKKILAFYILIITLGVIIALISLAFRLSPGIALLIVPLYIWITLASYFNFSIIQL